MTQTNSATSPCLIVIFGASGDLTRRKLIPALYDLFCADLLPKNFAIVGVSRSPFSDDAYREKVEPMARQFANDFAVDSWRAFVQRLHYHAADSTNSDNIPGLKQRMAELAGEHNTGDNVLYYLSVGPSLYDDIIENLGRHDMVTEGKAWCSLDRDNRAWQRIVVEKPFGSDPASAAHLNRVLGRVFEEEDTYRIDHYLGKETVQNLLVFRFANAIFEPIWNRQYIDHVQITAAETVGVEGRGGYYDSGDGGAMRDMIQSHLLQVLAVVAMEPPVSMRADDVRAEKNKSLAAARIPTPGDVPSIAVRGQYGPGTVDGDSVVGYREEEGVSKQSQTDTYAALQVYLDTWRWQGVPFCVRSGKRMPRKLTEVVITFKPTPHSLFRDLSAGADARPPNRIVINIQPDEGIHLRFEGKVPGLSEGRGAQGMKIKSVNMAFDLVQEFGGEPPQAYSTLLLDALEGDQTLFKHRDEIERAWQLVQPVLDYWDEHPQNDLPNYAAGTWGPKSADDMLGRDGRAWHKP